jgi:nicotinate-nucleotide pyrophosphorylase (carboxylating)
MSVSIADPLVTEFQKIVARALEEDLHAGDVTASGTVPAGTQGRARIETREDIVVCGLSLVSQVFATIDPAVRCTFLVEDGVHVAANEKLAILEGDARSLLAGERTALNLLQRACAVASKTSAYVSQAAGKLRITDTRKTMPGLRALDRYAVRCGGGHNHRNDLGAGVLIKENHIRWAGSLEAAIKGARDYAPHTLRICCEVENVQEASRAVDAGADALLLDNMSDAEVQEAVALVGGRAFVEVSGGITLDRIERLATSGVDAVSVGALTHSATAVDLSMLMEG